MVKIIKCTTLDEFEKCIEGELNLGRVIWCATYTYNTHYLTGTSGLIITTDRLDEVLHEQK